MDAVLSMGGATRIRGGAVVGAVGGAMGDTVGGAEAEILCRCTVPLSHTHLGLIPLFPTVFLAAASTFA